MKELENIDLVADAKVDKQRRIWETEAIPAMLANRQRIPFTGLVKDPSAANSWPVGMCIWTLKGDYIYANNIYANMVGYQRGELCGTDFVADPMSVFDILIPETMATMAPALKTLVTFGRSNWVAKSWRHKDGYRVDGYVKMNVVRAGNNPEDSVIYIIGATDYELPHVASRITNPDQMELTLVDND